MPWWGIIVLFALGIIIPTALFLLYCMASSSHRKSVAVIHAIIRYGFCVLIGLICLYGVLSWLRSCASMRDVQRYNEGYKAGYEAGVKAVSQDPGAYF
mgnify:FL=1